MPKQGEGKTVFPLMGLEKSEYFLFCKSAKLICRKNKNLQEKTCSLQCFLSIITKIEYFR